MVEDEEPLIPYDDYCGMTSLKMDRGGYHHRPSCKLQAAAKAGKASHSICADEIATSGLLSFFGISIKSLVVFVLHPIAKDLPFVA